MFGHSVDRNPKQSRVQKFSLILCPFVSSASVRHATCSLLLLRVRLVFLVAHSSCCRSSRRRADCDGVDGCDGVCGEGLVTCGYFYRDTFKNVAQRVFCLLQCDGIISQGGRGGCGLRTAGSKQLCRGRWSYMKWSEDVFYNTGLTRSTANDLDYYKCKKRGGEM